MGGSSIEVYDADSIEEHNIANQLYPVYMVGKKKAEALADVCRAYGEVEITTHAERWDKSKSSDATIVISAVDNMEVRRELFEWAITQPQVEYFIDGRMSAQKMMVYTINTKSDEERQFYRDCWYPQEKASPEICGEKSVIFTVLLVAGLMLNSIKKIINGDKIPNEVYFDAINNFYTKNILTEIPTVDEDGSDATKSEMATTA
jgi:molybdopterin/thiamine biosynthesis adenylyltransferase